MGTREIRDGTNNLHHSVGAIPCGCSGLGMCGKQGTHKGHPYRVIFSFPHVHTAVNKYWGGNSVVSMTKKLMDRSFIAFIIY